MGCWKSVGIGRIPVSSIAVDISRSDVLTHSDHTPTCVQGIAESTAYLRLRKTNQEVSTRSSQIKCESLTGVSLAGRRPVHTHTKFGLEGNPSCTEVQR